jgi:hypothetical protein
MAVKGNGYTKTTWAFQERPVASSKLSAWDDRIEASLELIFFLLNHAWGGGNGVVRAAATDDLKTVAATPPAMYVTVKPGYAFISKFPYKLAAATDTTPVTAPTAHPRIDLIQARLGTWGIGLKLGTEATNPSPPNPDSDCLALARLYLRPGMTSIKDTDDSVNGYIIDVRSFV